MANGRGQVVGINTAVAGIGLGLAVPIDSATRRIVAALMRDGRVRRAHLGIAGGWRPLPPRLARELGRAGGIEVVEVVPGSPAANAGLRPEDIVLALDGTPVEAAADLQRLMVDGLIGRVVVVDVVRDGRRQPVEVTPTELAA